MRRNWRFFLHARSFQCLFVHSTTAQNKLNSVALFASVNKSHTHTQRTRRVIESVHTSNSTRCATLWKCTQNHGMCVCVWDEFHISIALMLFKLDSNAHPIPNIIFTAETNSVLMLKHSNGKVIRSQENRVCGFGHSS